MQVRNFDIDKFISAEIIVVAYFFEASIKLGYRQKLLLKSLCLLQIQLRSPDATRLGWNSSWVKPWSEATDILEM